MKFKNYMMIILGTLICAVSFNIFLLPYDILPGGISGISMIIKKMFDLDISITIALLSLMCLIIGLIFLKKEEVYKSILGTVFFSLFVYITSILLKNVNILLDSRMLAAIMGGVCFGIGLGLVYREGYETGGVDILRNILSKYFHLTLTLSAFIIDVIIAIIAISTFDFATVVYSVFTIFISTLVSEQIIIGISGNKSFYIITTYPDEVEKFILNDLGHGVTLLKGKGAYTKENRYIVFSVIPTRDYYKLKDGLKKIDNNAFFVVSSSYEVGGGK